MHEASIALSIVSLAEEYCQKTGYQRIDSIAVDIGSASGVLPDALRTAFDIAKADSLASNALLVINEIPIGGNCNSCKSAFTTNEIFILGCPDCGSADFKISRGRELDLKEIEVN